MATDAASILSLALQLVSAKIILILALGITAGLFAWAMWYGKLIPLAIAASFAILVFLPILLRGDRNAQQNGS
jgi:hypothetical protein